MRVWQFSRPKGPGFGISRHYYLSVLSSRATMPALLDLLNPDGARGAVVGMGAPLMPGATKDSLSRPMERGAYALATGDRKTVVKLLVLSKEEAGFDPEALLRSSMAAELSSEATLRIRAAWTLAQATFESHHPEVFPALRFHLALMKRLAELTDGVVADPVSQRYLLPTELLNPATSDTAVDVRDLVAVRYRDRPDGLHGFTLGLQKLALPELEIVGLAPDVRPLASEFLLGAAQSVVAGNPVTSGGRLGSESALFEARDGGLDRGLWEGVAVLELLPPTRMTATDALEAWARERVR